MNSDFCCFNDNIKREKSNTLPKHGTQIAHLMDDNFFLDKISSLSSEDYEMPTREYRILIPDPSVMS